MLPRRKPKPAKRSSRWKSQKHRTWLTGFVCCVDNEECDGATECAHVRIGSGAGMGQKPDDWHAVPLCRHHHSWQHNLGERSFWEEYRKQSGQTVEQLIDELCKASPCAYEIREHRNG